MIIDKNGQKCNCNAYGCFEAYASMKRLKDRIIQKKGLKSPSRTSAISNNKRGYRSGGHYWRIYF